jgi:hypothetical protein
LFKEQSKVLGINISFNLRLLYWNHRPIARARSRLWYHMLYNRLSFLLDILSSSSLNGLQKILADLLFQGLHP